MGLKTLVREPSNYDAIIVGAGHNGLVTANYLARSGMSVLVLEKREVVGGACVTEEVWPGIKVSTLSYVNSMLDPQIINDFDLGSFGFKIIPKDPPSFTPFLDGSYQFHYADKDATRREIAKLSEKDAARYDDYSSHMSKFSSWS